MKTWIVVSIAFAQLLGFVSVVVALARQETAPGIVIGAIVLLVTIALLIIGNYQWRSLRADINRVRLVARQSADRFPIISHEIRTPLSLIKGASDLLLEESPGKLNARQKGFMRSISANSMNLVDLAEDLLTQARIDSGLFTMKMDRVDLRSICQGIVKELHSALHIEIALDSSGAPPKLWVDSKLIKQALINLINNAVKASPEASIINVKLSSTDFGVNIVVSDNGSGMNDEARARLFQRFASGHPLRDGTGLGLVITKEIAEMHGGTLFVDTVMGKGTTIIMSLPNIVKANVDEQS
ncbi:MAG: HAMP domain-containing histidine kinase [Actinobacteria bacterium]|nr:HAMP domain-containing histidine kinase [Actinomycetota bacterium]